MSAPTISREELGAWLDQRRTFVLIDTALDEDYASQHLPGAKNACVFEVNFLEQVCALNEIRANLSAGNDPPHEAAIVVYGASDRSLASITAADKLLRAGFVSVREFRAGLAGWLEAGLPVEGSGHVRREPALEDRAYTVDHNQSVLEWVDRSLGGKHAGKIAIRDGGNITLCGGRIAGGSFTVDMSSIENTDSDLITLDLKIVAR